MQKSITGILFLLVLVGLLFFQMNCTRQPEEKPLSKEMRIERGQYLVNLLGCNDCHSPKVMTANGLCSRYYKIIIRFGWSNYLYGF